MELNILLRTEIDDNFNLDISIEGIYTNLKRKELEREWAQKGKELVPEHIKSTYEYYNDLKSGKIMGEDIPAIQIIRERKMEQCAFELGKLEGFYSDEDYRDYYAKCMKLSWKKDLLIE